MALRQNLAPNPACKVNGTGWSSNPAGYARSTSVDAGLPRATGFEGTIDTDVLTPRAAVTAGLKYVWGVSIKAVTDLTGEFLVNYYTLLSGGSFVANSGASVGFTQTAGTVVRYEVGPFTVPSGAAAGNLKLNDLFGDGPFEGHAEITAYMVEQTTSLGLPYFDGDSLGASWDGTAGNSTSTIRTTVDTFTVAEAFSKTETPAGPYWTQPIAFGESFTLDATASVTDPVTVSDGFLVASVSFDEARGRVRVDAFTFAPSVRKVRVSSRTNRTKFSTVRGGEVGVTGGFMNRPVDDYEYVAGVDTIYLIEGVTDAGATAQSAQITRSGARDRAWIKFVANPVLNQKLRLTDYSEIQRQSRSGLYEVLGRSDPVIVSDVHGSRKLTINVACLTQAEADNLDHALSQGIPCFLQMPPDVPLPSIYASIGDYAFNRPDGARPTSVRRIFEIPLTEVAAPPPSVVGAFATWATVLDQYATWDELLDLNDSWREVAA